MDKTVNASGPADNGHAILGNASQVARQIEHEVLQVMTPREGLAMACLDALPEGLSGILPIGK
ncbi:MAG: hypothetical protein GDA40_10175 [Rhodobacteraceae bacterium]|nr:hypothetical protein [Paracoccaceae bacterium]